MKINPVFLEGFSLLDQKMIGRIIIVLYLAVLTFSILLFLPDAAGNILSPGFNPPDLLSFIISIGQITSSIFLLICYSILSVRSEETTNWIIHGRLNIYRVFAGRFIISLLLTIIMVLSSVPWFIYAARVSAIPQSVAVAAALFNGIALLTYGHVWILAGFIFSGRSVVQTVFIWIYIFIYLLISARILPAVNPILILQSVKDSFAGNSDERSVFQLIQPTLYINLFLFLAAAASASILRMHRIRKYE